MRRFPAFVAKGEALGGAFLFPAHLRIPSLAKQGPVNFLLDTGAGEVVIGEDDLIKLGIDLRSLPPDRSRIAGWGGTTEAYSIEGAFMILVDDRGQSQAFEVGRTVCGANPRDVLRKKRVVRTRTVSIPSVIGRNFLRRHGLIAHIDLAREDVFIFQE